MTTGGRESRRGSKVAAATLEFSAVGPTPAEPLDRTLSDRIVRRYHRKSHKKGPLPTDADVVICG